MRRMNTFYCARGIRMSSHKTLLLVIAASALTHCAVAPSVPVNGKTVTSPTLQRDTVRLISIAFQAKTGCPKIEVVDAEILSVAPDVSGNGEGAVTKGIIKERWTAAGCGQRLPLEVTFTPDGKGGSYIGFTIQK